MVIGVVWMMLGMLYWAGIFASGIAVACLAPKGRRARYFTGHVLVVVGVAWALHWVPFLGLWLWTPLLFVALLPVVTLQEFLAG